MSIKKITPIVKDEIKRKSPEVLPLNPSESGYTAQQIKQSFYKFITDETNSVLSEQNRIVDEANTELDLKADKSDTYTKAEIDGSLSTIESEIDGRVSTAEREIDTLQAEMVTAQGDITTIKSDISTAESEIDTLQEKDTTQDGRLTNAEGNISRIDSAVANLQIGVVSREIRNGNLSDMLLSEEAGDIEFIDTDTDINPNGLTNAQRLTKWVEDNESRQPNESDALIIKDNKDPDKDYVYTYYYWNTVGTSTAGWKLADIGHAPPPLKDQRVEFTQASTRENILSNEDTKTLFGKISKYQADIKPHAFNNLATAQGTQTDVAPSNKLLTESTFTRVYRTYADLSLDNTATAEQISAKMENRSVALLRINNIDAIYPSGFGFNWYGELTVKKATSTTFQATMKTPNGTTAGFFYGVVRDGDTSNNWSGWRQIITNYNGVAYVGTTPLIDASSDQTITGAKAFTIPPRNNSNGFAGGNNATTGNGGAVGQGASANNGGGAVGYNAKATYGGAVGQGASANNGGGAVGYGASAEYGGAVGWDATATYGGAVGNDASATLGGAVGWKASATTGGAVGNNATTRNGGAVGNGAKATADGGAVGNGAKAENGGAVGNGAKALSGGAVGWKATETLGGGAVGYQASATYGGAVGYQASAAQGGAVGQGASATLGGAVGNQASAAQGGAVGNGAKALSGGAVGWSAKALSAEGSAFGCYANVAETDGRTIRLGDNDNLSALKCKVELTVTSDERDKADINNITNSLDFIDRLTPITYKSNQRISYLTEEQKNSENYRKYGLADYDKQAHASGTKKGSRQRVGLKAQEIQEALLDIYGTDNYANIVDDNFYDLEKKPTDVENQLTVAYSNLIPFLIGAIKEQQAMIKQLQQEINTLKGEQTNGNNR